MVGLLDEHCPGLAEMGPSGFFTGARLRAMAAGSPRVLRVSAGRA